MIKKLAYAGVCALLLGQYSWAESTLRDVRWSCSGTTCQLVFPFAPGQPLPSYYQKYDAGKQNLRVAFSLPEFTVADGLYALDASSPWVRSVKVSRDTQRKPSLLYLDFACGAAIQSDRNAVKLRNKNEFSLEFPRASFAPSKSWNLSKLKLKSPGVETPAKKPSQAEPLAQTPPPAMKAPAPIPQAAAPQTAPSALRHPSPKGVSSQLLPGLGEVSVLLGGGLEQLQVRTEKALEASQLERAGDSLWLRLQGPVSSPLYKFPAGSLAKAMYWSAGDLVIVLRKGVRPVAMVQGGKLLVQAQTADMGTLDTWVLTPSGASRRTWKLPAQTEQVDNLESFASDRQKSATLAAGAQTIQVRQLEAAHIVVDDAVPLTSTPSEQGQVLATLNFGDRVRKIEGSGLFYKVKAGDREGYVNRRQVAMENEMSPAQKERLLRQLSEKPDTMGIAVRFETAADERITYSSFGRRDPFLEVKGVAEEGVNIDQVELAGIIWESEVPMALLSDTKVPGVSYTLREGDKILNGKVLKITKTDVLFLIQEFGVSRRYSLSLPDRYGVKK